jgi:hypothetical protein
MRSFMIFTAHQIYRWSNQEGELCARFWRGNPKERETLEDVDGRIILKWILKKEYEGMNWIRLAQDETEGTVIVQNISDYSLIQ